MDTYRLGKQALHANRAFYEAFQALDLAAMEGVWVADAQGPHAVTARCVHPGSAWIHGRDRIFETWRAIFDATESIRFELADLEVEVHGGVACVHLLERITARAQGVEQQGEAVATNLFLLVDGAWRMFLHHASPVVRQVD